MAFLTVRVPEALKKRMKRVNGVNWSGVIRSALEQRLQEEMDRRRKDRDAIIEAMKEQDEVAAQLGRKPATGWKGVEVIRYWREHRYSSSTHR